MKLATLFIFWCNIVVNCLGVSFCGPHTESKNLPEVISPGTPTPKLTPQLEPTPILDTSLVVEGISTGPIRLGDTFEDVIKIIPVRKNYDEVHDEGIIKLSDGTVITCAKVLYKNSIGPEDDLELAVYFDKNDHVVQIEGRSPRYHLQNEVHYLSKLPDMVKKYPDAQIYVLKGSGSNVVGGKDLVYLVDQLKGLAFEFQYSRQKRARELEFFIVFPSGNQFLPGTCVTPPQRFELADLNSRD